MRSVPGLLIIGGTGRKSGKTTLACNIISHFMDQNIIAVKISPHIHNLNSGSELVSAGDDYEIYRESSPEGTKDSAMMLKAGAKESYYIYSSDNSILQAFNMLISVTGQSSPVICESPVLRKYVIPGLYLLADSSLVTNRKDLSSVNATPDITVILEKPVDVAGMISIGGGKWRMREE